MKIRLLLVTSDNDYVEHLSQVLSEKYADTFEVTISSAEEKIQCITAQRFFDIALLAPEFVGTMSMYQINLPLLLWDGLTPLGAEMNTMGNIRKYQRISSMVSKILEYYADVANKNDIFNDSHAAITVAWSPAGGCGKTTAALAYASQKVSEGKKAVYLNLESFCSTPAYFPNSEKSISTVFEKLDSNVELLIQSIRKQDSGSGICYFSSPENYDDINILSAEDIVILVENCTKGIDELVIDLSSTYNEKTRRLLELADAVLLVIDTSRTGQKKWEQFQTQHNLYEEIRQKIILVANRGAGAGVSQVNRVVKLPYVQSEDPVVVYKTLSAGYFN